MSDYENAEELFAAYTRGEISPEQLKALETELRRDAALRRDFIEYLNVDSALGDLAALSQTEMTEIEAAHGDLEVPTGRELASRRSTFQGLQTFPGFGGLAVGVVAAALLIATIAWFAFPSSDNDSSLATLVSTVDASLKYNDQPYHDTNLDAGEYELEQGLLHLQFGGNVMVYVEAPARFDAVSDTRLVLHSGRMSASVPPEGIGFTIETPEAEVIDFGTEFSVEVASGTSEVHVFEGLVRVQPRARKKGATRKPVDLRTSQAVKVEGTSETPVEIELATDRFIRAFDEPKLSYPRVIKRLSPLAYYRMPIRDRGLAAEPPQYSGVVLIGEGRRPPHARGVSAGGSLRVLADSTGRGGRVDAPPQLTTGQFTLAVFVYLENQAANGVVATNIQGDQGNFALSLNELGSPQVTIRNTNGELATFSSESPIQLETWHHLVTSVDGEQVRIYLDGQLVAASPSLPPATSQADSLWFGTDAEGLSLWDGRIDELALFDRALSAKEIGDLYLAAQEETATK